DFTQSRNLIIAAIIMVSAIGFNGMGGLTFVITDQISISLSGLAIAAILGIVLNAVLPGNTYEFHETPVEEIPDSNFRLK
ncbi:MAG: uracil-xanthine permease, partial [Pygmaiobacter massiliensis]